VAPEAHAVPRHRQAGVERRRLEALADLCHEIRCAFLRRIRGGRGPRGPGADQPRVALRSVPTR
jgi:hypothetical protein